MSAAWRNWSGTVRAHPARVVAVADVSDIVTAVGRAARDGMPVRAVGSGHSFTDAAATDGVLLDLRSWTGIERVDGTEVTVRSGTTLHDLNAALATHDLAMTNLGDIDAQTISGAISTGTHGTGARLGGLATQVAGLELVLADGSWVSCSAYERPELFDAARIGLGAYGVVTRVRVRCERAFGLHAIETPQPLDDVLLGLDEIVAANDHVEFYWFPRTRTVSLKTNNRVPPGSTLRPLSPVRRWVDDDLLTNRAFDLACRGVRRMPRLAPTLTRAASRLLTRREYSDVSHRVFTTPRSVRFVEMEYAVPRAALTTLVADLVDLVEESKWPIAFPVEVRVAAADDVWLSTAYGQQTGYVAVHQYAGMPFTDYFRAFELLAREVGGRPHWGKLHGLGSDDLAASYPRFADAQRVRAEVDPEGRWLNRYTRRVFGLADSAAAS